MFPIGLSSCGKILNEALFRAYRESGISHMEISPKTEAYDTLDYRSIAAWAKEYGVTLWSFHLPFLPSQVVHRSHTPSLSLNDQIFGLETALSKFLHLCEEE